MRNRFYKWTVTTLAAVMVTCVASAVALGATAKAINVSLDLKDVDVKSAIEYLFRGTGRDFIIDPDVPGIIPSVSFKEVPFDVALKMLAKNGGLTYRLDSDIYLIQKKQPVVDTAPPAASTESIIEPTTTEETVIDKIPLSNTGATELLNMMNGQTNTNSNSGFGGSNSWGGGSGGFGGGFGGGGMGGGFGGNSGFGGGGFGGSSGGFGGGSYGGGGYGGGGGRTW